MPRLLVIDDRDQTVEMLHRRLPQRKGFKPISKKVYALVNLYTLEEQFEAGAEITPEALIAKGILRNLHDGLHRIFDAYGPKRFFWGTDITRMPCTWRQCITMFTEELPWLKGRDLEDVMGRGLCEWIGWNYKFD